MIYERCTGCGSVEALETIRASHPAAIACCPERHMVLTLPPNGRGSEAFTRMPAWKPDAAPWRGERYAK